MEDPAWPPNLYAGTFRPSLVKLSDCLAFFGISAGIYDTSQPAAGPNRPWKNIYFVKHWAPSIPLPDQLQGFSLAIDYSIYSY